MKFLCTADWHIKKEAPVYRTDDYLQTQLGKVRFLVDTANKENAVLLHAGDIYDSPKAGYYTHNQLTRILCELNHTMVACFGNHDTTFHSQDLSNTPYGCLVQNGVVRETTEFVDAWVIVHALGWESTPPTPVEGQYNILLGHVSVFEKAVPFWAGDGISANDVEKKYPGFDAYVFGDIHIPFTRKNPIIINPGSLCRMNIDQVDFKPRAYLFDTDTNEVTKIDIPIKPKKQVFDLAKKDLAQLKDSAALNEFVKTIQTPDEEQPNFKNVLHHVVKEANTTEAVESIINSVMEDVQCQLKN